MCAAEILEGSWDWEINLLLFSLWFVPFAQATLAEILLPCYASRRQTAERSVISSWQLTSPSEAGAKPVAMGTLENPSGGDSLITS